MRRIDESAVVVVGANDLTYAHDVEIRFVDFAWYAGASYFSHALFRAATAEELHAIPAALRAEGQGFAIVTEHGNGPDGPVYVVVAARAEVEFR